VIDWQPSELSPIAVPLELHGSHDTTDATWQILPPPDTASKAALNERILHEHGAAWERLARGTAAGGAARTCKDCLHDD